MLQGFILFKAYGTNRWNLWNSLVKCYSNHKTIIAYFPIHTSIKINEISSSVFEVPAIDPAHSKFFQMNEGFT